MYAETPGGGIPMGVVADSAVNRNRLPVFIPDFAREGWVLELLPGVRIARLGKFISPRFASRYLDGMTFCALLHPAGTAGGTAFFDCALTVGEIRRYGNDEILKVTVESAPLKNSEGEVLRIEKEIPVKELNIEELIARASTYCTLKSGDVVLLGSMGLTVPVALNRSVECTVNSETVLATRMK